MRPIRLLIFAVTVLICGCGKSSDDMSSGDSYDPSLPGVYSGTFPCRNCPGIETTLWLRPDKRFFFRQRYPEDTDSAEVTTFNLGRWNLIADGRVLDLRGAGPVRSFTRSDRDTLLMRGDSELEHRLSREPKTTRFTSKITMSGMMSIRGDGASFRECLTGLSAVVEKGGDYARFQRQYRSAKSRGEPAFVDFEGRFIWLGDGSLKSVAIERFKTVREGKAC